VIASFASVSHSFAVIPPSLAMTARSVSSISGANVLSQADYAALTARLSGFQSGVAKSVELNKVWRQASVIAAMIAQFTVDQTGQDVLDDGDVSALLSKFQDAILAFSGGRLLNVRVFSTPGTTTYTPTAGTKSVIVEVQGAGGAGGNAPTVNTSQFCAAGGGGAGGYAKSWITSGFSGVTVTVGAGGVQGGTANGGTSSFGSLVSASGGGAGGNAVAATTPGVVGGGGGGSGSGGNIFNNNASPGSMGIALSLVNFISGPGGQSTYGGTSLGQAVSGAGDAGNLGSGGSGAATANGSGGWTGGRGGDGFVIVWEYA